MDPSQPATIQKILRETHEEMLPRQTVTLDDILKSSRNRWETCPYFKKSNIIC